jgi:hypothetical protein
MKLRYVLIALILFVSGCAKHVKPTPGAIPPIAVPEKAGPEFLYPNPQITPGATNPDVTQDNIGQTICKPGWTATVRPPASYTNNLKREGIVQYGYTDSNLNDYEEDHFIPIELGGSPTDPNNLWPEPYNTEVNGKVVGAIQKDLVENLLRKQVCNGTITLKDAQDQIARDWYMVYLANF